MDGSVLNVWGANYGDFGADLYFNTTANTYTFSATGSNVFTGLVSITIGGTDVTNMLTNVTN